jgi:hypothetical protein
VETWGDHFDLRSSLSWTKLATVILHPGGKVEQFKQETQLWVQVETAAVAGSSLSRM